MIEEAPAPNISLEFRQSIGAAAVAAGLAVGYQGAGTVEFIVDTDTGDYFFMEMNTRLQVCPPTAQNSRLIGFSRGMRQVIVTTADQPRTSVITVLQNCNHCCMKQRMCGPQWF